MISEITKHPKVPPIEQVLSVGAAAQNILLALHDMGYGAIWRTGSMAFNKSILSSLKLKETSEVVGYLYIGSIAGEQKKIPDLSLEDFVTIWN